MEDKKFYNAVKESLVPEGEKVFTLEKGEMFINGDSSFGWEKFLSIYENKGLIILPKFVRGQYLGMKTSVSGINKYYWVLSNRASEETCILVIQRQEKKIFLDMLEDNFSVVPEDLLEKINFRRLFGGRKINKNGEKK